MDRVIAEEIIVNMNSQVPSLIAILPHLREDGALFILRNPDIVELLTPPEKHQSLDNYIYRPKKIRMEGKEQ